MYRNGYLCIYKPEHHRADSTGMVYEHVLVAENILGRKLKPEEVVHHEDRCRSNNAPSNLYVFASTADHTRYHNNDILIKGADGVYVSPILKVVTSICPQCKKEFEPDRIEFVYCSKVCSWEAKKVAVRPCKDDLYNMLVNNPNFTKLSATFGVTDNAVRKWCKSYGIPHQTKYYKSISKK